MKVVIYGLGAIIIFILLANLWGIAFTLMKFHELKASTRREAIFLIVATLLVIWATQRAREPPARQLEAGGPSYWELSPHP